MSAILVKIQSQTKASDDRFQRENNRILYDEKL